MEAQDIKKCSFQVISAESHAELREKMSTYISDIMDEGVKLLDWKFSSHSYTDEMGEHGERFTIVTLCSKAPEPFTPRGPIQTLTFENR